MLILDAGAFIAVERGNREVIALVKREQLAGRVLVTHGGIVGQVWRGGRGRQALVAKLLAGVDVVSLDDCLGGRAGMLLALTDGADTINAAAVCLASDGDDILTSGLGDITGLARTAGVHVELIAV